MIVNCKNVTKDCLPTDKIKSRFGDETIDLVLGKDYVVYALSEFYDYVWYCISEDEDSLYPMWYPCALFEIVDPRLSRFWIFSFSEFKGQQVPKFAFAE